MVVDTGPRNTTNQDTLRSERRSTLKKYLTGPTLLEMSGWACSHCRKRAGFSQVPFFWEASGDSSSGFVTDSSL